jgi:hypothetical protein
MTLELPETTTVETKDLRQLLRALVQGQLVQAKKLTEHMLKLDREQHPAQD